METTKIDRIGLIKLFLPVSFSDESQSTGYNVETINFASTIADTVYLLSSNDMCCGCSTIYRDTTFFNCWNSVNFAPDFKYLFVFCSKVPADDDDVTMKRLTFAEIDKYLEYCKLQKTFGVKIFYVVTDFALVDERFMDIADVVFSQSVSNTFGNHLPIYENIIFSYPDNSDIKKDKSFVYIGNYRGRVSKLEKYFLNNSLQLYGKHYPREFKRVVNFLQFGEAKKMLASSKATLVLADESYEQLDWLTPRYYEALSTNTIAFVDADSPAAKFLVDEDDFRIVHDDKELLEKLKQLEYDDCVFAMLLRKQQTQLKIIRDTHDMRMLEAVKKWL